MAYKMTLSLGGKTYDVLSSNFSFSRSVDPKGRPSSGVYGGEIHLVVESYADTTLVELMLNKQHTAQSGSIAFDQGTSDGKMKEIKFTDGFITNYTESASAHGADAMTIAFTISAREIKIGDAAVLSNAWPENKA
jgi:hypothetical protein